MQAGNDAVTDTEKDSDEGPLLMMGAQESLHQKALWSYTSIKR